jgi:hypothetical protein
LWLWAGLLKGNARDGNQSRSEQDRLSLSQLARMAPASLDIHAVVIVVKFNFAKGLERRSKFVPDGSGKYQSTSLTFWEG